MPGVRQVEARWGVEFWGLVSDFANQGLTRCDVAKALGYSRNGFYALLDRNPRLDPFESANTVADYVRDTGESLRCAVQRMAAQGCSKAKIARTIGYSRAWCLDRALKDRGIESGLKGKPFPTHEV